MLPICLSPGPGCPNQILSSISTGRSKSFDVLEDLSGPLNARRRVESTDFASPAEWTFHSPIDSSSPVFLTSGVGLDSHDFANSAVPKSSVPTLPVGTGSVESQGKEEGRLFDNISPPPIYSLEHRQTPKFSESPDSFLSQSTDNGDALPPSHAGPSEDLLEFVLRLTDTPPGGHFCGKSDPKMMEEHLKDSEERIPSRFPSFHNTPFLEGVNNLNLKMNSSIFGSPPHTQDGLSCSRNAHLSLTGNESAHHQDSFPKELSSLSCASLDNTCRSSLSLISHHGFASLTTAASTPAGLPGTPTWTQDFTNRSRVEAPSLLHPAGPLMSLYHSSPTQCVDEHDDNQHYPNLFGRTANESDQVSQPLTNCDPENVHFQLSPPGSGLRHLHSNSSTRYLSSAGGAGDEDYNNYQGGGSFNLSHGNRHNQDHSLWDDNNERPNSSFGGISKGLTDFYSIAYASKRWQNLNVVLPLYIPHGTIAVVRSTGESTYIFPDQNPSAQLLFSGAGKICDLWATYLRLRVAVIHKCPEFLVPRVAQAFNNLLANMPKFAEPIRLRCAGMVKHTIQLRSSGGLTYRYDTIGQLSHQEDQAKMRVLFDGLQKVMTEVNHRLAREVEEVFRSLQNSGLPCVRSDGEEQDTATSRHSNAKCGLEFRFSPCRELKIAIREGTLCDCAGVDSVIAGGGASSMSSWAQQFVVENLIIGEVRLERDKTSETQHDPFFAPNHEVKTRMISKDLDGNAARICFVDPAVYPAFYRPRVENAIGLTPLQAAEQLCGATHQHLASLLPNGMASLTSQPSSVHIPGVPSHLFSGMMQGSSAPTYSDRSTPASSSFMPNTTPLFPTDAAGWLPTTSSSESSVNHPAQSVQSWNRQEASTDPTLKGLAVLQKMLASMSLGKDESCESANGIEGVDVQALQQALNQATAAAVVLGRHQANSPHSTEASLLVAQLQSALQRLPYAPNTEAFDSHLPHLSFPRNEDETCDTQEDRQDEATDSDVTTSHIDEEPPRGSKSLGATPAHKQEDLPPGQWNSTEELTTTFPTTSDGDAIHAAAAPLSTHIDFRTE